MESFPYLGKTWLPLFNWDSRPVFAALFKHLEGPWWLIIDTNVSARDLGSDTIHRCWDGKRHRVLQVNLYLLKKILNILWTHQHFVYWSFTLFRNQFLEEFFNFRAWAFLSFLRQLQWSLLFKMSFFRWCSSLLQDRHSNQIVLKSLQLQCLIIINLFVS